MSSIRISLKRVIHNYVIFAGVVVVIVAVAAAAAAIFVSIVDAVDTISDITIYELASQCLELNVEPTVC